MMAENLSPDTSIDELLTTYPFLIDFLVETNPRFALFKGGWTERVRTKQALIGKADAQPGLISEHAPVTLRQVASAGGVPVDRLIRDITIEIESQMDDQDDEFVISLE